MREVEIKKWIIRINESKKREKADLIGIDKKGNEYTFRYWDGMSQGFKKQDIICEEPPELLENKLLTKE